MSYSSAATIRLVVAREVKVALRSKPIIIALGIMMAVAIAGAVAMSFLADVTDDEQPSAPSANTLAVAGVDPAIFDSTTAAGAEEASEGESSGPQPTPIEAHTVASREEAEKAVYGEDTEKADAALVAVGDNRYELLSDGIPDSGLFATVQQMLQAQSQTAALRDIGADPNAYAEALVPTEVKGVDLSSPDEDELNINVYMLIPGIAILSVLILLFAGQVGSRVTEEKSSRVVEILLATVRPSDFLAGKIIGSTIIGFASSFILLVTVGIGLAISGVSAEINFDWSNLPILLLMYLLGALFIGSLYAAAGALVARTEDLQSTGSPIMFVAVAMMYAALFGYNFLDSTFMTVVTWIPPLSITVAPLQYAAGNLSLPLFIASYALVAIALVGVIMLTGRVYRNAILRNGTKVKWSEALKS